MQLARLLRRLADRVAPKRQCASDELELRIAALETVWIEVGAIIDPSALADGRRAIIAGIATASGDEAAIRHQALVLIRDAQMRYAPGADGTVRPGPLSRG